MTLLAGLMALALAVGDGLAARLVADGPALDNASKLKLFGQFVGDWECDVVYHRPDGTTLAARGEWYFGWILEGRAIQDVWRVPARGETGPDGKMLGFGTTIRLYDPSIDAWHVVWTSAIGGGVFEFTAAQRGQQIVMDLKADPREPSRWVFSEITPTSFHWRSESSSDAGRTWTVDQEMSVRRREQSRSGARDLTPAVPKAPAPRRAGP
jgi:hypothetical protein